MVEQRAVARDIDVGYWVRASSKAPCSRFEVTPLDSNKKSQQLRVGVLREK